VSGHVTEPFASTKGHSLCIAGDILRECSPNDSDCCIQQLNSTFCALFQGTALNGGAVCAFRTVTEDFPITSVFAVRSTSFTVNFT